MAQGFTQRETRRDRVRLSYLDNDVPGPVVVLLHGLAEFVAARPGTRHVVLGSGTHDAHWTRPPSGPGCCAKP